MNNEQSKALEWWKTDPLTIGDGLGIVLHQKRRGESLFTTLFQFFHLREYRYNFVIATVLAGSPAKEAGLRVGDHVHSVGDYELAKGDLRELVYHVIRPAKGYRHDVRVSRAKMGDVAFNVISRPIRDIISGDPIFSDGGGGCRSCRLCFFQNDGWAICGSKGCSIPCMLA